MRHCAKLFIFISVLAATEGKQTSGHMPQVWQWTSLGSGDVNPDTPPEEREGQTLGNSASFQRRSE
jgi:hypothetical protein